MLLNDTISSALEALARNRLRSLLTTLGIVIGVGSVVLMVSMGASFEKYIEQQLAGISAGTIDVYPKGMEQFGRSLDTITFSDAEAIAKLSTVKNVAPGIFVPYEVQYRGDDEAPFVIGTLPGFYTNYGIEAEQGRILTEQDSQAARYVAVLGPEIAEDLFGDENPMGKRITINGYKLTVVGITKSKGSLTGQDIDSMVTIPYSVSKAITGAKYLSYITLQATQSTDLTIADIKSLLRERHGLDNPDDDPDKDDFLARGAEQAMEILDTVTMSLTLFVGLVAGISLLVGGIGIMNIMLVSVSERTKEIGLRKAVGARRRDVLFQFLLEAVVLTMFGGAIGIVSGIALAYGMTRIANAFLGDFPFAVSWAAIVLSVFMALGTGLGFGLYPARKAANLSPMEAMRWE